MTTALDREARALLSPPTRPRSLTSVIVLAIVGLVVGLAAGLGYSLHQNKLYGSQALVRVYNPYRVNGVLFGQVDQQSIVTQEGHYATSAKITDAARSAISARSVTIDHVDWQALPSEDALSVTCYARQAAAATQCAETYAETYVSSRRESAPASITKQNDSLTTTIASVKAQIAKVGTQIARARAASPVDAAVVQSYVSTSNALYQQLNSMTTSLNQGKQQAETLADNYEIVAAATSPHGLAVPATQRNVVAGGAAGLLLGLLVAAAWQGARAPRRRM
jgi:uncharacterized protein involved in exopolysaccharide biosynthesis